MEFYVKNYDANNLKEFNNRTEFIENLPSLNSMYQIIEIKLLKKEYVAFKIVLDIYEHFYTMFDGPSYKVKK